MSSIESNNNVDHAELAKFSALASKWWDPNSEFRPLHEINPLRLNWIDERVGLKGKKVLDVGCGGGILAESMARRIADNGHPPLYVSLDIDCLDPAFAPGTGTPEPGGLASHQVLSLLEALVDLDCVGMDCVEVSPPFDHAELSSQAAAAFVWTYLCSRIAREQRASLTG